MNLHMYWMQGWDKAPPRALRNRDAWKKLGFNVICWDDSNVDIKWNSIFPAAMRADISLSRGMYRLGGIAVGADSSPIDTKTMLDSIKLLPPGIGQLIWQSKKSSPKIDRPYIAGSYFPKGNEFIKEVVHKHNNVLKQNFTSIPSPINYTGPHLWAKVYKTHSSYVNVIDGEKAFLTEPRTDRISDVAWLDAGFANDWNAKKTENWK